MMEQQHIKTGRYERLNSNPDHAQDDLPHRRRLHVTSEVTREMIPYACALLFMIALFITTTIVYLHTTSGPALRASAEHIRAIRLRDQTEQLSDTDNPESPDTYTYSIPRGDMCFFRSKLTRPGMPTVHSIFADPISRHIVVTGVRFQHSDWRDDEFLSVFEGDFQVACDPVVNDDRSFGFKPQYVIVVTCSIPTALLNRANFTVSFYRKVGETFSNEFAYRNITVCTSGASKRQRRMLSMCTMLKDADEFIPDWIAFHRYVGVDHIFIYDNQVQELSNLSRTVASDIESGFVTVIPWAHKESDCKNYLEVQIAHENDCLWRNRHTTKWMIKTDVDEYVQPMNPNKPRITDYLDNPLYDRIGAVRLQNWFFGRPNLSEPLGGQSLIQRNVWRSEEPTVPNAAHDKNIVRPINVHYFKIHAMKLGGSAVTIDPWTELRLAHFRGDNPRKRYFGLPDFVVQDTSISDIMDKIAKTDSKGK